MEEQRKAKFIYWLVGLFTGCAVTAPITAFITKRVFDKKKEEKVVEVIPDPVQPVTNWQQTPEVKKEDDIPDEEDINNYDISIDDEEATEEARERTEEHERYLDMIDKYSSDTLAIPYTIDGEEFTNSHYMEKSYINWYEKDNVFEEDLGTIDDPYLTFGVTDGHELFKNADMRPDPDIVFLRSERNSTDYEITRIHGSYAELVGGEKSLGETDTQW